MKTLILIVTVIVLFAFGYLFTGCQSIPIQADKADYPLFVVTGKWIGMTEFADSYSLTIVYETEKGRYIYRPVYCKTVYHEGVFLYNKVDVWKNEDHDCYLEAVR